MTSVDWFIVALALLAIGLSSQSRKPEGRSPGFVGYALWALIVIPPALALPLLFTAPVAGALLLGGWTAFWLIAGAATLVAQGTPVAFRAVLAQWRAAPAPFYAGAAVFLVWVAAIIYAGHSAAALHH